MYDEISQLKARLSLLENENRLLKERLTEAGISYADIKNQYKFGRIIDYTL